MKNKLYHNKRLSVDVDTEPSFKVNNFIIVPLDYLIPNEQLVSHTLHVH